MSSISDRRRRPVPLCENSPAAIRRETAKIRYGWNPFEFEFRRQEACFLQKKLLHVARASLTVKK